MDKEEAYNVLGILPGSTQKEMDIAIQQREQEIKLRLSGASTAILRQVGFAELKELERSISLISTNEQPSIKAAASFGPDSTLTVSKISMIICVLLIPMVFYGTDLNKTVEHLDSFSSMAMKQLSNTANQASVLIENLAQRTQPMGDTNTVKTDNLYPNKNGPTATTSSTTMPKEDTESLVSIRNRAEIAGETWESYRKKNNIPQLPQAQKIKQLLSTSNSNFRREVIDQAKQGYLDAERLYTELIKRVRPVVEIRGKSEIARLRWHQYRKTQQLYGNELNTIDQQYNKARALEEKGSLLSAVEAYRNAAASYEKALANGPQLVAKSEWLYKMRKRLAEIERE